MQRYKVGIIIFGILIGIMLIGFLTSFTNSHDISSLFAICVVEGIFAMFLIYNIVMCIKTKNGKPVTIVKPHAFVSGTLIDGLPIPAAVTIVASLYDEKIKLVAATGRRESENQHFELEIEKIQNAMVLSESQIQQIITQSAPGMIIGAAAFGLLGAMVGGRVKTKQQVNIKFLFLLEYVSEGEKKQVLLYVGKYPEQAESFVKKLNSIKPLTKSTIQL